ncbi:hypothetical protein L195_g051349, partial [Trifolium pratense]
RWRNRDLATLQGVIHLPDLSKAEFNYYKAEGGVLRIARDSMVLVACSSNEEIKRLKSWVEPPSVGWVRLNTDGASKSDTLTWNWAFIKVELHVDSQVVVTTLSSPKSGTLDGCILIQNI